MYCVTPTNAHAAVPVSQLFFACPSRFDARPAIVWLYTYGSVP